MEKTRTFRSERCQHHLSTCSPAAAGSGKTSLILALAEAGLAVSQESGRAIIREQQAQGGTALPWLDPRLFARCMQDRELQAYRAARATGDKVFFDRGLPDVIGYLRLSGLTVPAALMRAARCLRYQPQVFVLPHWPAIYHTDAERRQTAEQAQRTCDAMRQVYQELGYQLVEIPLLPLQQRRDFILHHCELSRAR